MSKEGVELVVLGPSCIAESGPLNFFDDASNCYLLSHGSEIAVIDPGVEPKRILDVISSSGKRLVWVAATHGHYDHMESAKEVSMELGVPFYMHPKDYAVFREGVYQIDESEWPECQNILGQELSVGGVKLDVIETPGHTFGSVSFFIEEGNALFCGDWIGSMGDYRCTRGNSYSDEEVQRTAEVLFGLPEKTTVFPGHGEPMTMIEFREKARGNLPRI